MNENLFVYGTLINQEIQKEALGKTFEMVDDSLVGWKKSMVQIEGETYPILEKSKNRFDIIFGKVFEITEEDLKKIDKYETDEYRRIQVSLSSGEVAWVYVK